MLSVKIYCLIDNDLNNIYRTKFKQVRYYSRVERLTKIEVDFSAGGY